MAEEEAVESNEGTQDQVDGPAEFAQELSESFTDPDLGGDIEDDDQAESVAEEPEVKEAEQPVVEEITETPEVQEAKTYKVPDDALYGDLRGSKATALELEEAGLLEKLVGREHQELHHVKLYQDANDKIKALEAQLNERVPVQDPNAQPQAPPMSVEDHVKAVQSTYLPRLQQLAEEGAVEPDFLRAYPKVSSQLENRFQSTAILGKGVVDHVTQLTTALNEVREFVGMQRQTQERTTAETTLASKLNDVAASVPALKDEGMQTRFRDWAADPENTLMDIVGNTPIADLTGDQLKGAFAAYVAITGDGIKQKRRRPREGASMAGGGGASRGSASAGAQQNKTGPQQLEAELAESGWRG